MGILAMKRDHSFKSLLLTISTMMVGFLPAIQSYADSNGIIVESVNEYAGAVGVCEPLLGDLCNSIANGDGFLRGMVFPGSRFFESERYTDGLVYDRDFVDT